MLTSWRRWNQRRPLEKPTPWGDGWGCSSGNLNWIPKEDQPERGSSFIWPRKKSKQTACTIISSSAILKDTSTAKNSGFSFWTLEVGPKSVIYTPERDDEYPRPFHVGVSSHPPPLPGGSMNFDLVPSNFLMIYICSVTEKLAHAKYVVTTFSLK